MKSVRGVSLFAVFACPVAAGQAEANPLGKVLELMGELTAKVTAEGEAEAKAYSDYVEWCDKVNTETKFAIKSATSKKEKLDASIADLSSDIQVSTAKIEELAADIASSTKELADATSIRKKEAADFAAAEAELVEGVDTLARAIQVLEKEMQKNPALLAQVDANSGIKSILASLGAVVDAAGLSAVDRNHLLGLLQSQQHTDDDELELGAPAAANYKTHSGGIVDVLGDMKEKAEGELSELRKAENAAKHNFNMLKGSLDAQLADYNKDLEETKTGKAAAEESKAEDEGELSSTVADLKGGEHALATAQGNCMQVAADHGETVKAREEELKVIAKSTQILKDTASGAVDQTYSFLELGSQANLARSEVVALVKQLARKEHSMALSQLASRIATVSKYGSSAGEDVFGKIKGLIQDMIEKLEKEAGEEAEEKAFCDEELAKTKSKKDELDVTVAKLTSKIDQDAAKSAGLKDDVKEAQADLAALSKQQAEMDTIRREENAAYTKAKADLELGLSGVRKALEVLRNYYGSASAALVQQPAMPKQHSKSGGAAGSIINILEVCESDFAGNLAKEETQESDAAAAYEKTTQENKIMTAQLSQDVKYNTQEFKGLDKAVSEVSSDRETTNTELGGVLDYYEKLKERCIAKPESYEERKRRREEEIAGLKEALSVLDNEVALVQRTGRRARKHGFLGMH